MHVAANLRPPMRPGRFKGDFALVAMPGLLGLRIFQATGADITDLSEEHGHRVLGVCGKGTKVVLRDEFRLALRGITGPDLAWR